MPGPRNAQKKKAKKNRDSRPPKPRQGLLAVAQIVTVGAQPPHLSANDSSDDDSEREVPPRQRPPSLPPQPAPPPPPQSKNDAQRKRSVKRRPSTRGEVCVAEVIEIPPAVAHEAQPLHPARSPPHTPHTPHTSYTPSHHHQHHQHDDHHTQDAHHTSSSPRPPPHDDHADDPNPHFFPDRDHLAKISALARSPPPLPAPCIEHTGTGLRVRDARAFLASPLAAPATLDDPLCAELAQGECLDMLRAVLPDELATITWYNRTRLLARVCPACQRLYTLGDALADPLDPLSSPGAGRFTSSPPKPPLPEQRAEQALSGLCSKICFSLSTYNHPLDARAAWGTPAHRLPADALSGPGLGHDDGGLGRMVWMTRRPDLGLAVLLFGEADVDVADGAAGAGAVQMNRVPSDGAGGMGEPDWWDPSARARALRTPLPTFASLANPSGPPSPASVRAPRRAPLDGVAPLGGWQPIAFAA